MEKIDLTKCNNCRFKAEISNSGPISGRIKVEEDGVYLVDGKGNYIGILSLNGEEFMCMNGCGITGFEIVPRDPETYKDWQVGDIIRATDGYTGRIIFRSGDFVAADIGGCRCSTCEELFNDGYRLVLTDIENQIIEEKKKYEPQDGDVVYAKVSHNDNDAIFIYKKAVENRIYGYAGYNIGYDRMVDTHGFAYITPNIIGDLIEYRPATEEEKQMLFDAMAKQGKRWNAEKKVVEDIPKPYKFKKGEPVLVRDNGCIWKIGVFTEMRADYFQYGAMTNGLDECGYHYCLPYNERTMHLLGTTEDYKEGE